MLIMVLVFRKHLIPLAFLLALSFAAGIAFAPVLFAGQIQNEQCCDKDAVPAVPGEAAECSECNGPACQFVINARTDDPKAYSSTETTCSWLVSGIVPSEFIRTIDYPPEFA